MSDLHCPATLLLAPYDQGAERSDDDTRKLAQRAAAERVSRVYGGTRAGAVQTTRSLADVTGVPAEPRPELDSEEVAGELQAIADLHRGETVLVVLPGSTVESALDALVGRRARLRAGAPMQYGSTVEVADDADGWTLRTRVTPTDSVPQGAIDRELRDVRPN